MNKREMQELIREYQIKNYYVIQKPDGSYDILFGDDDPMKQVENLKMEVALLRDQLRCMASITYGIPYDKAEELIK